MSILATIISGLVVLLVSGLTFIAYKHPLGFREIARPLIPAAIIGSLGYIAVTITLVCSGVRSLAKQAVGTSGDKIEVYRYMIEDPNRYLTYAIWGTVIILGVWIYMTFLWFLRQIIEIAEKQEDTQPEEEKVSSESSQNAGSDEISVNDE